MVKKVHGFANSGESLTGNMEFFLFRTVLDIRPNGIVALANDPDYIDDPVLPYTDINNNTYTTVAAYNAARDVQRRFDHLVRVISTFAQPVIIGSVVETTEVGNTTNIPSESSNTNNVTVYNLRFALEKKSTIDVNDFYDLLGGVLGFVSSPPTARNHTLTSTDTLE